MAKKVHSVQFNKATLNVDTMEVVEFEKEIPYTYSLLDVLREFDSKTVTISIKEELPVVQED